MPLHYNTVTKRLRETLNILMMAEEFKAFHLVGGTALSLYRGHRKSVDIDLFTDAPYNSINFNAIDFFLRKYYTYVDTNTYATIGLGTSYYVGENTEDCIKLDLFYTDPFIKEIQCIDHIRLASIEDIIAMKIDVILRGGRKKDFWDIHELMPDYTLENMLSFHQKRYPYTHDQEQIKNIEVAI